MQSSLATFPATGIDTVQKLDAKACRFLVRENIAFVVRYLGGLEADELRTIMACGLALMPVTYGRKNWTPSAELGHADGIKAINQLTHLKLPKGCTVWLDLESCIGPADQTAAWVNAWATEIKSGGYEPGLYVGAGGGLSDQQLWKLKVVRYWRSCSIVPEPSNRGFCMFQLRPCNTRFGPLTVDVDAICEDWKSAKPTWVVD